MPLRKRVLIVDDDSNLVESLTAAIATLGATVTHAFDGKTGLERALAQQPHLIILDLNITALDGLSVCDRLRQHPRTRHTRILMLTANPDAATGLKRGAHDYLRKPFSLEELLERSKRLMSEVPPYPDEEPHCLLTLLCEPGQKVQISASGMVSGNRMSAEPLLLDPEALARQFEGAFGGHDRLQWKLVARELGKLLYERIFSRHPAILAEYARCAATAVGSGLRLRVLGNRASLRTPFETLFDPSSKDDGSHLIMSHPVARTINGIVVNLPSCCPSWLNELSLKNAELRILLVASDTGGIPGVDEEVAELTSGIPEWFDAAGVATVVDSYQTDEMDGRLFRTLVAEGGYHIVHFAGHGVHRTRPERSALFLWDSMPRQAPRVEVTVTMFEDMLRGTDVRLVYLSCCEAASAATPESLLTDDFLGLADGVARAGVPGVIGFRRAVADTGARQFAAQFYQSLAARGDVEVALFLARRHMKAWMPDDPSWLTPILIRQDSQ